MKNNKFFNKKRNQLRIEEKIQKYYKAIDNEKIRSLLDKMPKNKQTLEIIESELTKYITNVAGDSNHQTWATLVRGMKTVEKIIENKNGE